MNGKTRRFAAVFLSAFLYAQAGLCIGAVSLVVLKHHAFAGPVSAADIAARHVN